MTFYLIGLGLNENSITKESLDIINKTKKLYLEGYTVAFPYNIETLEKNLGRKVTQLKREAVEKEEFLSDAKKEDVSLLVYGAPLSATTHYSIIEKCKKEGINYQVLYNGSVIDAVAESGLQLYKFGKTASMPRWISGKYEPDSFLEIIKDNNKIKAHTLLLIDIGMSADEAVEQLMNALKKKSQKIDEIMICSRLGTAEAKFYYGNVEKLLTLTHKVKEPFCFIIPSEELHFAEEEALELHKKE
ncbi:MAG: diphthine synthase [Nanoarchaeota archaeon]